MLCFVVACTVLIFGSEVHADVKSYCQAYGAQVASSRISGGTILTGENPRSISLESWRLIATAASEDCRKQYEPEPSVAESATAKVAAAVAEEPKAAPKEKTQTANLEPGSADWNEYCSKKYNSFNPETGTYTSRSGKQRRCVVTR